MIRLIRRNDITFSSAVKEAISHRLYEPNWTFEELLHCYDDNITNIALFHPISVVYGELILHAPVGIAMSWFYPGKYNIDGEHIGCWVKPEFRRQGIGSQLVKKIGMANRHWMTGEYGSEKFFMRNEECGF